MRIGIVGSGLVGSTAAYALVMKGIGSEIVLVDQNRLRATAEADDILHAVPFAHPMRLSAGDYEHLSGCSVVVIAAGVNQKVGETRLQLLRRNALVFADVVPKVLNNAPNAILVVATNPVDIMTHIASEYALRLGAQTGRVLGTGTTLDTARFRTLIGSHFNVDAQHVHAYVIGEHGDSEVLTWSLATIAGLSLNEFSRVRGLELNTTMRSQIDDRVRRAAYHIIQGKGATYYGIGSAIARIVDGILRDQRSILTVCSRIDEIEGVHDVTVSLPHLLTGAGVLTAIPLAIDDSERLALQASAHVIRQAIDSLELDRL